MSDASAPLQFLVGPDEAGRRLDAFLVAQLAEFSRSYLRRAFDADGVTVDGRAAKPSHKVCLGEQVSIVLPEPPVEGPQAEDIPLELLFEDDALAVVDKPPAMVVHPSRGHWSGTLAAALRHHFEQLSSLGGPTRPGILHRLDRDTTGVIAVAKTDAAHAALAEQFAARTVEKEYFALTAGVPDRDRDVIELAIGPHPSQREKMAVARDPQRGRSASTFYEVTERFRGFAAIRLLPKTGRTHQIRVHLAAIGCPVLCDRLYGGRARLTLGELARNDDETPLLERQALHARRLCFDHPTSGERMEFSAPLPADLTQTLDALRQHRG